MPAAVACPACRCPPIVAALRPSSGCAPTCIYVYDRMCVVEGSADAGPCKKKSKQDTAAADADVQQKKRKLDKDEKKKKKDKKDKGKDKGATGSGDDAGDAAEAAARAIVAAQGATTAPPATKPTPDMTTILLFYGYMDTEFSRWQQDEALEMCHTKLTECGCTGRLRVGREGFNGTLTGKWSDLHTLACTQINHNT